MNDAFAWSGYDLLTGGQSTTSTCCGDAILTVRMGALTAHSLMESLRDYRHCYCVEYRIAQEIAKLPLEHESLDYAYMRSYILKNLPNRVENSEYAGEYFYVRRVLFEPEVPTYS